MRVSTDLTDVILVSEDTYQRPNWCDPNDPNGPENHDKDDNDDNDDHNVHDDKYDNYDNDGVISTAKRCS